MHYIYRPLFSALALFAAGLALAQTGVAQPSAVDPPPASPPISSKTLLSMCMGCHGIPGYKSSFPEVHRVPKIEGQNGAYLEAALKAYRAGDRKHPTMRGIAAALDDKEISRIAAYYAAPSGARPEVPATPRLQPSSQVATLLQRGACISCHGTNFTTPVDLALPKLAGQYSDYLFVALRAYKIEGNPVVGRAHPVMTPLAKQFTNAELKLLADYIGSLKGELTVSQVPALR
ncbi:MAG: c-type cytochrome [Polaromonas sp.]|nr:c-type cytochrome [Polaromonas sp.]